MTDVSILDDGTEVCLPVPETWSDSDDEVTVAGCELGKEALDTGDEQAFATLASIPGHNHSDRNLIDSRCQPAQDLAALAHLEPTLDSTCEVIDDSHLGTLSPSTFAEMYAGALGRPVVLKGIPAAEGWKAETRWTSQASFVQHYGDLKVQVTEMGSLHGMGRPFRVEVTLRNYATYAGSNQVDWPFYVWERNFNGERKCLLEDFSIPKVVSDDLYDVSPEVRDFLPLTCHLFVLVGGRRTGSNMHKDPKWSSAWNTLLCGKKRWVMFPRDVPAKEIGALEGDAYKDGGPQAYWWLDHYPRLRSQASKLGMVDILQQPGDTVFIPAGWWHATLNLPNDDEDITIACTRNVFLPASLPYVLPLMRQADPSFASTFINILKKLRPDVLRYMPVDDSSLTSTNLKPVVMGATESWQICRRQAETLSLAEFRRNFVRSGKPIIIEGLGAYLVSKESCGLSRDWLCSHFGEKCVAVYRNYDQRLCSAQEEERADLMRLREVMQLLQQGGCTADGLYLYDLSLPLKLPGLLEHIRIPRYFAHCYLQQTMRRHVFSRSWPTFFIGAKGSQGRLHVDQWHGHFWMHLVSGRKKWTIFHPDDALLLGPIMPAGKLHPVFPDLAKLEDGYPDAPHFSKARRLDVILEEGETLFVPGGAPHFVVNITDTVAFAGNFIDDSNFEAALADMKRMAELEASPDGPLAGVVTALEEMDFDAEQGLHEEHLTGRSLVVKYKDFAGGAAAGWGVVPPSESDDEWS